jgi:hypothetical protein
MKFVTLSKDTYVDVIDGEMRIRNQYSDGNKQGVKSFGSW